jgi:hypothetical protein
LEKAWRRLRNKFQGADGAIHYNSKAVIPDETPPPFVPALRPGQMIFLIDLSDEVLLKIIAILLRDSDGGFEAVEALFFTDCDVDSIQIQIQIESSQKLS